MLIPEQLTGMALALMLFAEPFAIARQWQHRAASSRQAMQVRIDDLEDSPIKYIGQRVKLDAQVERVLGPRLFTIDEPNWADLAGEILVVMGDSMAAQVRAGNRVTVEGLVRSFLTPIVEQEWGWLTLPPDAEARTARRPIVVADRLVGQDGRSMIVRVPRDRYAIGSDATPETPPEANPITSTDALEDATLEMVGRRVHLDQVSVGRHAEGGFFVRAGSEQVFVLPTIATLPTTARTVTIEGVVLQMPDQMAGRIVTDGINETVYVYATDIAG